MVGADAAVEEHAAELLATAMALTGRAGAAVDLVAEALTRVGGRRDRTDLDPAGRRELLVRQHLARRRARVPADAPTADQDGDLPAELALVAARLDRLPPTQRAVVVLTFRDRVTQSEIAAILDRSTAAVDRLLTEAVRAVDTEPVEIAATLDALAWQAPEPALLRPALLQHRRRRRARRRRVTGLLGVVAAVLAVAVLVPTVIVPRLPAYVRPDQEWSFGYTVQPPPGWTVVARYLTPVEDTTLLYRGKDDYCQVTTSATGTPAPVLTRRTRVHGRPGGFAELTDGNPGLRLVWTFTPGETADVTCFDQAGQEPVLREVAAGVEFRRVPLMLPVTLAEVPRGYSLESVTDSARGSGLQLAQLGTGAWGWSLEFPADSPGGASRSTTVAGRPAEIFADESRFVLCLKVQGRLACLEGFNAYDSILTERRLRTLTREGARVADTLRFAPDITDRATWFDAADALPH